MYIESPSDHHFGCTRVVIISTLKANCLPVRYNNFDLGQCKRNFGLRPTTYLLCHKGAARWVGLKKINMSSRKRSLF